MSLSTCFAEISCAQPADRAAARADAAGIVVAQAGNDAGQPNNPQPKAAILRPVSPVLIQRPGTRPLVRPGSRPVAKTRRQDENM